VAFRTPLRNSPQLTRFLVCCQLARAIKLALRCQFGFMLSELIDRREIAAVLCDDDFLVVDSDPDLGKPREAATSRGFFGK